MRHKQLQEGRENIQNEKKDGEDVTSKVRVTKKLNAAICGKEDTNRLEKSEFYILEEKKLKPQPK